MPTSAPKVAPDEGERKLDHAEETQLGILEGEKRKGHDAKQYMKEHYKRKHVAAPPLPW